MKELNKPEVKKVLAETFDQTAGRVHEIYGRYWNSRLDASKTVLTLTTAILAGTVTFSTHFLESKVVSTTTLWALKASWSFFAFSLLAALYALWHLYQLTSIGPAFFNKRKDIDSKIDTVSPKHTDEELSDEIKRIIFETSKQAAIPISQSDKRSHFALGAQFVLFGIGMATFFIFGILLIASPA